MASITQSHILCRPPGTPHPATRLTAKTKERGRANQTGIFNQSNKSAGASFLRGNAMTTQVCACGKNRCRCRSALDDRQPRVFCRPVDEPDLLTTQNRVPTSRGGIWRPAPARVTSRSEVMRVDYSRSDRTALRARPHRQSCNFRPRQGLLPVRTSRCRGLQA